MASEAQVLEITELRLGLPGRCREVRAKKRALSGINDEEELVHGGVKSDVGSCYVKVGFDGAPFLRKLNLSAYEGYEHLEGAIKGLFEHLQIDCREYIHVYEDREGDWMLVGDVPWE
ncbi:Auxin-induced protein AUX22 [Acorus calamus]|uniref:Auxin-responsive protein n=1 Tax=Acorus calamus TaxID=4465 RepID=A0AAV9F485_ACOCL|nr:Auxin-induced protein AUX22 [Acorus calamus]